MKVFVVTGDAMTGSVAPLLNAAVRTRELIPRAAAIVCASSALE